VNRQEQILNHFARFHRANPQVWKRFCHHVRRLTLRGAEHYSARTIISVIRFERDLESMDIATGFHVNNNFSPYYARMWEIRHPDRPRFFSKRRLISKQKPSRARELTIDDVQPDMFDVDMDVFLKQLLRGR